MGGKKKKLILYAAILFAAVIAVIACIKLIQIQQNAPYCEMPRVVFSYRNDGNDVYVFDSEGDLYKISRLSEKSEGLSWLEPTLECLEKGQEEAWLEKAGTADKEVLQEKYNIFRKVTANPKYEVFCTDSSIPNAADPDSEFHAITDYWYGHISDTKGMYFYYTGHLKYDVTDKTIYQVVDWIRDEVNKCERYLEIEKSGLPHNSRKNLLILVKTY